MAIDWSPLVAQNTQRNERAQEGAYAFGDMLGNKFSEMGGKKQSSQIIDPDLESEEKNSNMFSKLFGGVKDQYGKFKDNMTDQEGLFQGGYDSGEERNRLFGRTRDAIEGVGQIGGNTLKSGLSMPGQFIKGMKNSGNDPVMVPGEEPFYPTPDGKPIPKKSLMDYIKGIKMPGPYRPDDKGITKYDHTLDYDTSYDGDTKDYLSEYKGLVDENRTMQSQVDANNKYIDMKDNSSNSFDPNVQPVGPTDDAKSLLDYSTDYKGDTEPDGYQMSHGQRYGPTDYGAYPEYGGVETSDFNKNYSGETDYVDYGQNYSGETADRYDGNADTNMLGSNNSKSSQESMQMNMQNLQQQYPNLQVGSMEPNQSYTIDLGDGQGMQSFEWNTGPMFGGK